MFSSIILLAAIELVSPAQNATVQLVPDNQKAVMSKATMAERKAVFAADRATADRKITKGPWRSAVPFTVTWKCTGGETGPWEILIGKKSDLSDARQYLFTPGDVDQATGRTGAAVAKGTVSKTIHCINLEIATTYYWKVSGNITCGKFGHRRICGCKDRRPAVESAIGSFTTEDFAPRWIEVEGRCRNFRDLGGRIGLGGKRVKQGLVFRSQGMNDNSIDGVRRGRNRLTCEDVEMLRDDYGVRTDLDLRGGGEIAGMNQISPLGKEVKFIWHSSQCYDQIFTEHGKKIMAENFRVFTEKENYPIIFHCIGGADRTGALAYVLNGVLGVSRQELETDWESTFYPNIPDRDRNNPEKLVWNSEEHFNVGFGKYGDENSSWNDRVVLYLKDCGITDEEIARFRELMLEK